MLAEQRAVQPLDEAVGLGSLDAHGAVRDAFELEEQLVRMPVGPAAERAAAVGEHGGDLGVTPCTPPEETRMSSGTGF